MATVYRNHSKFIYKNYDEIQAAINNNEIDIYDIVFTKDTKEIILVTDDYTLHNVKSRVYRFQSVAQAEQMLNNRSDTYAGQIVAIINNNAYSAYIVNKNRSNRFYVTPLVSDGGGSGHGGGSGEIVDYNTLGERPIENMYGTLDEPIYISELSVGTYKINGQYYFSRQDPVTHLSMSGNLFMVSKDNYGNTLVTKISPHSIFYYNVFADGSISQEEVATIKWIQEQGYATQNYVDTKIAALDIMTRQDIEEYVSSIIDDTFELVIDRKIDTAINQTMIAITNNEIRTVVNTTNNGG